MFRCLDQMEYKYTIPEYGKMPNEVVCNIIDEDDEVIVKIKSWFFDLTYKLTYNDYEYLFHYMKVDIEQHTMKLYRIIGHETCADYIEALKIIAYDITDKVDELFE